MRRTSVAMTAATEEALLRRLVRDDGQEDLCLATYRPSTGLTRFSALIRGVVPPKPGIDSFTEMLLLPPITSCGPPKQPRKMTAA